MNATAFATPLPESRVRNTTLSWSFPAAAGGFTLLGTSRAADATAFYIPELNWALDAGAIVFTQRPERIFLTHTHTDHTHSMTHLKSRRKPPEIYLPTHATALLEDYLYAAQILTDSQPSPPDRIWTPAYQMIGVEAGQTIPLPRGKKTYRVSVLQCDHSVPCVGYLFSEDRTKLKEEYTGLPGQKIRQLREAGTEITSTQSFPLFAFLGDTTHHVFETHPEILQAPVIITECTFLEEQHLSAAERTRHTHWSALQPIVQSNPNTTFVLTHFSLRYNAPFILDFLQKQNLPNLTPFLASP